MLKVDYCYYCYSQIFNDFGYPADDVFMYICEHYALTQEPFLCNKKISPTWDTTIRFLELKGFLLSTEAGIEYIQVKPFGYIYDDDGHTYCMKGHCH